MSVSTIILNYPKHPNAGLGWIEKTEVKALDTVNQVSLKILPEDA